MRCGCGVQAAHASKPLTPARLPCFGAQKKNPKKLPVKLEFMKYDPRVRQHVLFTETKLK